jgi:hypothetical protein
MRVGVERARAAHTRVISSGHRKTRAPSRRRVTVDCAMLERRVTRRDRRVVDRLLGAVRRSPDRPTQTRPKQTEDSRLQDSRRAQAATRAPHPHRIPRLIPRLLWPCFRLNALATSRPPAPNEQTTHLLGDVGAHRADVRLERHVRRRALRFGRRLSEGPQGRWHTTRGSSSSGANAAS